MQISLNGAGKKFRTEWIFKELNYVFSKPGPYAILGANGSGKSTLLKIISGYGSLSSGGIQWQLNQQAIERNDIYTHVSLCAPYMELPEEFTLEELLRFHFAFKKPLHQLKLAEMISLAGLEKSSGKQFKVFSSGMKQRVKLALSFFSDTPLLLLDEPCTNLDAEGVKWYNELLQQYTVNRLTIIASNSAHEIEKCKQSIKLEDYKTIS